MLGGRTPAKCARENGSVTFLQSLGALCGSQAFPATTGAMGNVLSEKKISSQDEQPGLKFRHWNSWYTLCTTQTAYSTDCLKFRPRTHTVCHCECYKWIEQNSKFVLQIGWCDSSRMPRVCFIISFSRIHSEFIPTKVPKGEKRLKGERDHSSLEGGV